VGTPSAVARSVEHVAQVCPLTKYGGGTTAGLHNGDGEAVRLAK